MGCYCTNSTTLNPTFLLQLLNNPRLQLLNKSQSSRKLNTESDKCMNFFSTSGGGGGGFPTITRQCTRFSTPTLVSDTESEYEEEEEEYDSSSEYEEGEAPRTAINGHPAPPLRRRLRRYRKQYPGEMKGVAEEMRFVAMKLGKYRKNKRKDTNGEDCGENGDKNSEKKNEDEDGEKWQPTMEGFLKYLVDSRLVFSTVERIVDQSADVSYVYFRKSGLERSDRISMDLEWFREQGNVIPEASNPGLEYAKYLEQLADESPPLFLSHLYNIYFSHIAAGQVIAKQVSKKIFEGKNLEFHRWDGDAEDLLKGVRDKLNALGEHWSRDEKSRCLRETTKAFRSLGKIVRLIIL
ncbi:hypothetical protein ABFX02_03G046900 [Erythranthe guttata]